MVKTTGILAALVLALGANPSAAQTPTPDPAPVPAPAPAPPQEPVPQTTPPAPAPSAVEGAPKESSKKRLAKHRETKAQVETPSRVAPLHGTRAEEALAPSAGTSSITRHRPLTAVSARGGSSGLPFTAFLLALLGIGLGALAMAALPARVVGGAFVPVLEHRGEVALGGFAVLFSLGVGVLSALALS